MLQKIYNKYNLSIVLIPLVILGIISTILMMFPEVVSSFIDNQLKSFIDNFSWYYLLIGFSAIVILIWLSFSKYGKVRLGDSEKPEYSNFVWASMIYTSTMAADLIYYSLHDWMNYYSQSSTIGTGSNVDLALRYPLFHFGPTPWAFYILPAVAYAYWMYVKKKSITKMSDALFLKNRKVSKIVDVFTILSVLIAASVTLTISISLTPVCINELFGFTNLQLTSICVIIGIGILYTLAILHRNGIEHLATSNVRLYYVLFAIFMITPSVGFIFDSIPASLGGLFQNFILMSLNTDPSRVQDGFVQNYTVFYWAYWIAWAVSVPIFIGKISKGRTIRNMIIGGMGSGILGGFTSFWIFGNYGLSQQISGNVDLVKMYSSGIPTGSIIIEIFKTFPSILPQILMALIAIIMMMQNATTLDSIILITSESSYRSVIDQRNPSKRMKIYWSLLFMILPIIFILNHNTISSLQTVLIFLGLPMSLVLLGIIVLFVKDLKRNCK